MGRGLKSKVVPVLNIEVGSLEPIRSWDSIDVTGLRSLVYNVVLGFNDKE